MGLLLVCLWAVGPLQEPPDWQDVVLRVGERTVRVRLHLRVNDRSFRVSWEQQLNRLFRHLDVNADGKLDARELRLAPGREQWQQITAGDPLVDPEPAPDFAELAGKRGHVTREALERHYGRSAAGPLAVRWQQWQPRGARTASDRLFSEIVPRGQRFPAAAHFTRLRERLMPMDRDENEMLAEAEVVDTRFFGDPPPREARGKSFGDAELGLPLRLLGPGDATPAGVPEQPQVVVRMELMKVAATPVRLLRVDPAVAVHGHRGGIQLTVENTVVRFGVDSPRGAQTVREDAQQAFRALDTNRNKFLSSQEIHRPPFRFVSWLRLADRNGDEQLSEAEFLAYAELLSGLHGQRTTLRGLDHQDSLFALLDLDGDGLLSCRELHDAGSYVPAFPKDKKEMEKRTHMFRVMRVQVGRDDLPEAAPNRFVPVVNTRTIPLVGPLWFRKMDTNGDGDLSRREWLGLTAEFDRIDTDRDGLISLEEALHCDALLRGK